MKLVYPDINCIFETDMDKVHAIVIENQQLLLSLLTDIQNQIQGFNGKAVLSSENKIIPINKNLEILDRFVPFDLNGKGIISKITSDMEKRALSDDYIAEATELVGGVDKFLAKISFDYPCGISFCKMNIGSIIKSSGIEICDDYENLGEKILDYIQITNDLLGRKLFLTVNLRAFISDKDAEFFINTVLLHGFHVIMIESQEHPKVKNEKRMIIDSDLCLIG